MACDQSQVSVCLMHRVPDASYSPGGPSRVDIKGHVAIIQMADYDLLYVLKVNASAWAMGVGANSRLAF